VDDNQAMADGEYNGDDAGSPVFAEIHMSYSNLSHYKASNNAEQEYEKNIPLETKAEQKKIPFHRGTNKISIDIRLQMGRYWTKLLRQKGLPYEASTLQPIILNCRIIPAKMKLCLHILKSGKLFCN
jgi:hypothetical protein